MDEETVLVVEGGRPLTGTVAVPGDKSISHRALLLGAVARGTSVVRGLSDGGDVANTAAAVAALGATVEGNRITGGAFRTPAGPLDVGNSGTTMRLLAGLVAGWEVTATFVGDASLSARPMDRVAVPLRLMGASVEGRGERCLPPVTVTGGGLEGIDYTPPMASAQVKSCVLLAGLRARRTDPSLAPAAGFDDPLTWVGDDGVLAAPLVQAARPSTAARANAVAARGPGPGRRPGSGCASSASNDNVPSLVFQPKQVRWDCPCRPLLCILN